MTDDKVLGRVRALLAKAESTTFPEEAEALTAKAQELMARYSIDEAMAASPRSPGGGPILRTIAIPSPYPSAKISLFSAAAAANRVRTIIVGRATVTAVGYPEDIDLVELLFTSLLVQASVAMHSADHREMQGRTRAFRHAFLLAFAERIAVRLRGAARAAEEEAKTEHGAALVPVLIERRAAVEAVVKESFPRLGRRSVSASHSLGWRAGTAAGDRADLGARRPLASRG